MQERRQTCRQENEYQRSTLCLQHLNGFIEELVGDQGKLRRGFLIQIVFERAIPISGKNVSVPHPRKVTANLCTENKIEVTYNKSGDCLFEVLVKRKETNITSASTLVESKGRR